ncbi:MAG: hypothetical protein K0R39_2266 [Symbiobacteriaceae bacterium]|jgi:hypothetical protein|nr:hypothetical protein [Symbiobacteriaceae bacterium]
MSEQQLARVLHEAAVRIEVPSDLFPRERLLAEGEVQGHPVPRWLAAVSQPSPPGARRRWPLAVAVAAALILAVTGFTPLGRAAVQKLGEVFMAFRVQEMAPAEWEEIMSHAPELPADWKPIQPGEVRTHPAPPETFRKPDISRGFTVQTLQEQLANRPWPIPTYMPPSPQQLAVVHEHYDVYDEPETIMLNLPYKVTYRGKEHEVWLSIVRVVREYDTLPTFAPDQTVQVPPGALEVVQAVEVKGITATAYRNDEFWTIEWYPPNIERSKYWSRSYIRSTLPLEEIIKTLESLPSWD